MSPRWLPAVALRDYLIIQSVLQRKQHFTITKISLLTLFKEIIAVYSENLRNIKKCRLIDCQAGGTDIYHCALKGYRASECFMTHRIYKVALTAYHLFCKTILWQQNIFIAQKYVYITCISFTNLSTNTLHLRHSIATVNTK
jgi:hypothetical protein